MGYRHVVLLLGCLCNIISYTDRSSLSLTLLEMEKTLHWFGEAEQGVARSAFFWGYLMTQLLGGLLSRRFGPKPVIISAVILWSLAAVATPSAARGGLGYLFVARVVLGLGEGVLLPCLQDLAQAWAPPAERSIAGTVMTSGQLMGTSVAFCAAPLVSWWWPSVFLIFGSTGFVWCAVFAVLVTSSPRDHRCVGKAEQLLIESGRDRDATASDEVGLRRLDSAAVLSTIRDVELIASPSGGTDTHAKPRLAHGSGMPDDTASSDSTTSAVSAGGSIRSLARGSYRNRVDRLVVRGIPWRVLLLNRALHAIYVAHWCHNWTWYLLLSWLPKFLAAQGADTTRAGFLSVFPTLVAFVVANLGAAFADHVLLGRMRFSVTRMRRLMGSVAHLGPAACLATLALIPSPGPGVAAALACGAIGLGFLVTSAFWTNAMDVAPHHTGVVIGLSNTLATLPGILCNLSTGWMLEHGWGWTPVLLLACALECVGAAVYVTCASGDPQL